MDRVPEREDTREFAARIWNIEHQVTERLAKAAEHNRMTMDERARHMAGLAVGKKAWLSSSGITMPWDRHRPSQKLKARYYGPFKILEQTSPVTFKLELPRAVNIHPIFHVGLLKAHHEKAKVGWKPAPLPKANDDGEYEIEKILGHRRKRNGDYTYLVKWKGYSYEESTWEPKSNFKSHTLKAYHDQRKAERAQESDSSSDDDDDLHGGQTKA